MRNQGATFSACRTYRYALWREVDPASPATLVFIGLNPSTADENTDDQTIRKCIGFSKRWGYGKLVMLNLFAFRATDPRKLTGLAISDAVGPENDKKLIEQTSESAIAGLPVICAWGDCGADQRAREVTTMLKREGRTLMCLGKTKRGYPKHPSRLSYDSAMVPM